MALQDCLQLFHLGIRRCIIVFDGTGINKSMWPINKTIAVVLAVLLGPLTWIYSFRLNASKLAISLGITLTLVVMLIYNLYGVSEYHKLYPEDPDTGAYAIIAVLYFLIPLSFGFWLWSLIDTCMHNKEWYNRADPQISGTIAVILAYVAGPWTWLYTYKRKWDWLKLLASLLIAYLGPCLQTVSKLDFLIPLWMLSILAIWALAITNAVLAKRKIDRSNLKTAPGQPAELV
jgi:hypothetical protein